MVGAVLAGGTGGAALLGAGARAARRPATVRSRTTLIAELSWQGGVNYVPTVKALTESFIQREWSSRHPGVDVVTWGWRGDANFENGTAAIASVLAGTGPDILMTCCNEVPVYIDMGIVRPLDDYIARDNIDVGALFPASVMQSMRTQAGTFGFPDYGSTQPLFYSQSLLDDMGIRYPQPDWTYVEAERVWRSIAGTRKGQTVYGANLPTEADGSGDWLIHAFGGHVRDGTQTRCLLDSGEAVAAYSWLASLTVPKVVYGGLWGLGNTPQVVYDGKAAFSPACCGTLQSAAMILGDKVKWDLLPMPAFPAGSTNFIGNGFYGINVNSRNDPELVWELFKFITTTRRWQLFFNAQLALQPPILLDAGVWNDWMAIVQKVAPPLRGKHLDYYRTALPGAYDWAYFRYAPAQADAVWTKYEGMILSGKVGAASGLRQAAAQINAIEAAGPATQRDQARQRAAAQAFLRRADAAAAPIAFPAPPESDPAAGTAPLPAGSAVRASAAGAVTLLAEGGGGIIGLSDNCLYAGSPWTSSRGTCTCRLVSVSLPKGGAIAGGAKVGLMARANLSSSAGMVAVMYAGGHGVLGHNRPLDDLSLAPEIGLLPSSQVQVPATPKAGGNWLLKPIWFRMVLLDTTWTPYISADGVHWNPLGLPQRVQWVGSWVGVFATSHQAGTAVQAVFDHLDGFAPSTRVQIGTP